MNYNVGDIIEVKVTSIENYGIFVKVDEVYNGMIHISEISDKFITNVRNFAFLGEKIKAKILDINKDTKQIKLTIKSLDYRLQYKKNGKVLESPNGFAKLKEMLPEWIEEKLKEIDDQ